MKRLALLLVLAVTPALAQQPQPSAGEQALGERLMQEIQSNIQARMQLIEAQRKLAADEARIKALEDAAKSPEKK